MYLSRTELGNYRLSRAIVSLAKGEQCLEREVSAEIAQRNGREVIGTVLSVPWQVLHNRDMAAADSGAFIVGEQMLEPADALRPASIVGQLGSSFTSGLTGNVNLPYVTGDSSETWLSGEADAIDATQPTVASAPGIPKLVGSVIRYSRNFRDAGTERFLERHLRGAIAAAIDKAALRGSGANGQPLGLANAIEATSGSGNWAHITDLEESVENAGAQPTGFVAHPTVKKALRAVERAAGSGMAWEANKIDGIRAIATNHAASGMLAVGDFRMLEVLLWRDGFQIAIDESTLFGSGFLQMRLIAAVDIVLRQHGAFARAVIS